MEKLAKRSRSDQNYHLFFAFIFACMSVLSPCLEIVESQLQLLWVGSNCL